MPRHHNCPQKALTGHQRVTQTASQKQFHHNSIQTHVLAHAAHRPAQCKACFALDTELHVSTKCAQTMSETSDEERYLDTSSTRSDDAKSCCVSCKVCLEGCIGVNLTSLPGG